MVTRLSSNNYDEQNMRRLLSLVLFFFCTYFAFASGALASAESDYNEGLTAYKAGSYNISAQHFKLSASQGKNTPLLWLYLGHAYLGSGDKAQATQAYSTLVDKFPYSVEAAQGLQSLQRLDPAAAQKFTAAPQSVQNNGTARKLPFVNRIVVVPPKMGHPAVSSRTIAAVTRAVQSLPRPVYKILDDSGATVNIAPNIEDKWPGTGDQLRPESSNTTLGEEPGRTYGKDVNIYERTKIRRSSTLADARSEREMVHALYHELGHAIDNSLGSYSQNDSNLIVLFHQDIIDMPADVKSRLTYFQIPMEGCAEVVGGLLGGSQFGDDTSDTVLHYMPRTKSWIKQKLHI